MNDEAVCRTAPDTPGLLIRKIRKIGKSRKSVVLIDGSKRQVELDGSK